MGLRYTPEGQGSLSVFPRLLHFAVQPARVSRPLKNLTSPGTVRSNGLTSGLEIPTARKIRHTALRILTAHTDTPHIRIIRFVPYVHLIILEPFNMA